MSSRGGPSPDFDPYFVPEDLDPKGKAGKAGPPGDELIRLDLLPAEVAFHVAGTFALVAGASVFVLFAVPVSSMLHVTTEPGGLWADPAEDWLWRRWVARMATDLGLSLLATALGLLLRRRSPWSRWGLIALGTVPLCALAGSVWIRYRGGAPPSLREFSDLMTHPCFGVFVYPAGLVAIWAACSRPGRTVLSPSYQELVQRTPKIAPSSSAGFRYGVALSLALLLLFWMLMLLILGVLAARGVIHSI